MITTLGSYVRELRQQKGLTLRQLAEKVELDFTYLSKVENDNLFGPDGKRYNLSMDKLKAIARTLGGDVGKMQLLIGKMPEQVIKDATEKEKASEFFRAIPKEGLSEAHWGELLNYLRNKKK
ncbi:MAG: helix-turn-helix transcriptional regulator [Patescibacteria group bacterium]